MAVLGRPWEQYEEYSLLAGLGFGFRFGVWDLGFGVSGLESRVWDFEIFAASGLMIQGV